MRASALQQQLPALECLIQPRRTALELLHDSIAGVCRCMNGSDECAEGRIVVVVPQPCGNLDKALDLPRAKPRLIMTEDERCDPVRDVVGDFAKARDSVPVGLFPTRRQRVL